MARGVPVEEEEEEEDEEDLARHQPLRSFPFGRLSAAFLAALLLSAGARWARPRTADHTADTSQPAALSEVPVGRRIRVACVGDSITYGLWASAPEMSYPAQLQRLLGLGYEVRNYGESGATLTRNREGVGKSYWESPRFAASISSNPDIVIVLLGTNDAAAGIWCARFRKFVPTYAELIQIYVGLPSKPRVIVAEPPPLYSGSNYASFFLAGVVNSVYPKLLPQIACAPVVPVQQSFREHCPTALGTAACDWIVSDGIHPNDVGYGVIARAVMEAIVASSLAQALGARSTCLEAARSIAEASGKRELAASAFCNGSLAASLMSPFPRSLRALASTPSIIEGSAGNLHRTH